MTFFLWIVIAAVAVLAAGCLLRVWAYQRRLRFRAGGDYAYAFARQSTSAYPVQLTAAGFVWPESTGKWDTAILEIRLRSTLPGRVLDPFIVHSVGGRSARQYFERGGGGVRFLNLASAVPGEVSAGDFVRLEGHCARWASGHAALRCFALPDGDRDSMLVIAPHPDDAELAAFGLYSSHRSSTLTVTLGEKGGRSYRSIPGTAPETDVRAKLRRWESTNVPSLGGVRPARSSNLGYSDSSLSELYSRRATAPAPTASDHGANNNPNESRSWNGLVRDLAASLAETRPRFIVTPHPILDNNADHQLCTVALLTALNQLGLEDGALLLYVIHSGLTNHFPFGGPGSVLGPPPWFEPGVPSAGCYSFPLRGELPSLKYFALESMSDLRPAVNAVTSDWPTLAWWFARQTYARFAGIRAPEDVQFARSLFQNEWFFVMPFSSAKDLMTATQRRLAVNRAD